MSIKRVQGKNREAKANSKIEAKISMSGTCAFVMNCKIDRSTK